MSGEFWMKAAQLILSLSILIVLHEMGHMFPAKYFKTRVEKFYLFFNPYFAIFRTKRVNGKRKFSWLSPASPKDWEEDPDTTEYGIGWLPLGGFVKIAGMIDESMDKEQMEKPAEPWEFRSKKAWQRLIIMIGGVVVNLILGFLIYMMVLGVWGRDYVEADGVKYGFSATELFEDLGFQDGDMVQSVNGEKLFSVTEVSRHLLMRNVSTVEVIHPGSTDISVIEIPEDFGMQMWKSNNESGLFHRMYPVIAVDEEEVDLPANKAGLETGDKILSVNGTAVEFWDQVVDNIKPNKDKDIEIVYERDGAKSTVTVHTDTTGKIGIGYYPKEATKGILDIKHRDYSFGEAISHGFDYGYWTLHDYVVQFKYVFTKKGSTGIGGFAAIGDMFPAEWDWHQFWLNTALISIILAFMNLLPIPALDGGHVIFLLWEMLTGRAVSQRILERAQMVGMVILLALLLYANGLDLVKCST